MRRRLAAAVASALSIVATAPTAFAKDDVFADGIDMSDVGSLTRYITEINLQRHIDEIRVPRPSEVERTSREGDEQVIALDSDILFGFDESDLSEPAVEAVRDAVADIPQGRALTIGGHTDSMGSAEYNQSLSKARAESVATVIRAERPDLTLVVEGFGPDRPVADNERGGEDYPEGRAQNRRVEIRYKD